MGNDVRIELPEERERRHWKEFIKPVGWTVLGVAVIASVIGIAHLMQEGSVVATTETAANGIDIDHQGNKAQTIKDEPGKTVFVGPDEVPGSVPGDNRRVLPPGTETLPAVPAVGAATSDAGGLVYVDRVPSGLMAVIGDQEPEKYIGQPINVQGAYVQRLLGEKAFALGPSANDFIIVMYPGGEAKRWATMVRPGAIVAVDGTLQQMPSDVAADRKFKLFAPRPDLGKARLYIEATNIGPKRQ